MINENIKKLNLYQTENGYEGNGYFINKIRTQTSEFIKESDSMFSATGRVDLRLDKFNIKNNTLHITSFTEDKIEKHEAYERFTKNCDIDSVKNDTDTQDKIEGHIHSRVNMDNLVEIFEDYDHSICVLFFINNIENQVSIIKVPTNLVFELVDLKQEIK